MRFFLGLPTDDVGRRQQFGTAAAIAQMAATAETLGFSGVHVTDHPAPPQSFLASGGHHSLDPIAVLSVAATATTSVTLMTNLYILGYRNPFVAAKQLATLDSISEGRLVLGTGAGYLEPEFDAVGRDFAVRNELLDEAIDICRRVWTGDPVDADGLDFRARGIVAAPTPVQHPHPPVWIGGNTRRARRRVVELGDGWIPMKAPASMASFVRSSPLQTMEDFERLLGELHADAEAAGRTTPIEVMFAPPGAGQFGTAGFDRHRYLDELGRLAALGVTTVGVSLDRPGAHSIASRAEFAERAAAFADLVGLARIGAEAGS